MYEKVYTRECSLITLQLFDEHQTKLADLKWTRPAIFEVSGESVDVYYTVGSLDNLGKQVDKQYRKDRDFINYKMLGYEHTLEKLRPIYKGKKVINNLRELKQFYFDSIECWKGVDVACTAPMSKIIPEAEREYALKLREKSDGFLDYTDAAFLKGLKKIFPKLGHLVRYITFDEAVSGKIPSVEELKTRSKHCIYFKNKVYTGLDLRQFVEKTKLKVREVKIGSSKMVKGRVIVPGDVEAKARLILKSKDADTLKAGEILITSMTTPGFMPAMKKAAAFVTDEGGTTSHAAIMAREMGKTCVIGTMNATKIFKTGDMVKIDSRTGTIKKV